MLRAAFVGSNEILLLLRWDLRCHEQRPRTSIIANWPSPRRTRPLQTCFLGSQMNAIRGFSARLNGDRRGHPAKMSSRQEQETPSSGLSGTCSMTNVENLSRRKGTVMSDCPASAPVRQIWQLEERR